MEDKRKNYNVPFLDWAKRNGISPKEFAARTGYSYMHAWNLLRGSVDVTAETLGRIAIGYGAGTVEELLKEGGENE
jgi:transcriptional regulator with XRE-family HTH domain